MILRVHKIENEFLELNFITKIDHMLYEVFLIKLRTENLDFHEIGNFLFYLSICLFANFLSQIHVNRVMGPVIQALL